MLEFYSVISEIVKDSAISTVVSTNIAWYPIISAVLLAFCVGGACILRCKDYVLLLLSLVILCYNLMFVVNHPDICYLEWDRRVVPYEYENVNNLAFLFSMVTVHRLAKHFVAMYTRLIMYFLQSIGLVHAVFVFCDCGLFALKLCCGATWGRHYFHFPHSVFGERVPRFSGILENPSLAAFVFLLLWPFWLSEREHRLFGLPSWLGITLCFCGILLSGTRMATLCLLAQILAYTVLNRFWLRFSKKEVFTVVNCLVYAIIITIPASLGLVLRSVDLVRMDASTSGRIHIFKTAWDLIQGHPYTGYGIPNASKILNHKLGCGRYSSIVEPHSFHLALMLQYGMPIWLLQMTHFWVLLTGLFRRHCIIFIVALAPSLAIFVSDNPIKKLSYCILFSTVYANAATRGAPLGERGISPSGADES